MFPPHFFTQHPVFHVHVCVSCKAVLSVRKVKLKVRFEKSSAVFSSILTRFNNLYYTFALFLSSSSLYC